MYGGVDGGESVVVQTMEGSVEAWEVQQAGTEEGCVSENGESAPPKHYTVYNLGWVQQHGDNGCGTHGYGSMATAWQQHANSMATACQQRSVDRHWPQQYQAQH